MCVVRASALASGVWPVCISACVGTAWQMPKDKCADVVFNAISSLDYLAYLRGPFQAPIVSSPITLLVSTITQYHQWFVVVTCHNAASLSKLRQAGLLDSACDYGNEVEVGQGIRKVRAG